MRKRYPNEFTRDVVAVSRRGDLMIPEVASDEESQQDPVRVCD